MSAKTDAVVVIDGKVYTLSGYEDAEYLQKVGSYINDKIAEIDAVDSYRHMADHNRHSTHQQHTRTNIHAQIAIPRNLFQHNLWALLF